VFVQVYDSTSLIKVAIYAGHVTDEEHERAVTRSWEMTHDAQRRPMVTARVIVIVETDEQPSPRVRKRLAEADHALPRCDFAFVSRSLMARAAMTAIAWLSPEREGKRRRVFSTFEEARAWLVDGGARETQLDLLYGHARSELNGEPRRSFAPSERPPSNRPPSNRPPSNRPPSERPLGERPPSNRPPSERPLGERPLSNRPPSERAPSHPPVSNPSSKRPSWRS
jgi:hypothetical protein